jgi:FtsP/CotA-like multicopper oxidase with cupredoxin domain
VKEGEATMSKTKKPEETNQGRMGRRDMLKITAASGAALAVAGAAPQAHADTGRRLRTSTCTGLQAVEAFPVSPLILRPFTDQLGIPRASHPTTATERATWTSQPGPGAGLQDADGGTHQMYPGDSNPVTAGMPAPIIYKCTMRVGEHAFSSSPVRTLVQYRNTSGSVIPAGTVIPRMPPSTIYGFNGTYYGGVMINAEYGKPVLMRLENRLNENPRNLDRGDFGDPGLGFLCHLHNGHTAAESDGNPHHKPEAYQPGDWVDNLYLNHPAGGQDSEKMSSLWFHDHREGHTGANVYKGMAGLYPIYDPKDGTDSGDETQGLRIPGVRTNYADGTFDVDYDNWWVLHDVALDDGNTPHQDFHNGCGEVQPYNWGKTFFRHFPNHGFVGDVFCVNGTAYPTTTVKRRKYRIRFLCASISRQYEFVLMKSPSNTPRAAVDLGYTGPELQGQYRLPDGAQCMKMTQIATGGGLLPKPVVRNTMEIWPAMRPQMVIDFTKYQDGTPTKKGDVVWLVNIAKMRDGRMLDTCTRMGLDPAYKIPLMKIVIGDDAPDQSDPRLAPSHPDVETLSLRPQTILPANLSALPRREFRLERGGAGGEIQWLINGLPFDMQVPMAHVKQGRPEVWTIKNGGGWSHPMHFHQEEHRILTRNGIPTGDPRALERHRDDTGKDDVIEMDASETVEMYRNFRTFTGKYVAHCHNLAHEDHAMMFGWVIEK